MGLRLSDYIASTIPDAIDRNRLAQSTFETEHTTLTVGNTVTKTTDELQRIKSVQVGSVSGGTVTVQVYVDDRPIFDDTVRPVSGGAVREPTDVYTFPAGSVISTIIEADSGTPAGTANIVIETEPYQLLPRAEVVELRGKDRLLSHKRRAAEMANLGLAREYDQPAAPASVKIRRPAPDDTTAAPTAATYRRAHPEPPIKEAPRRPRGRR